jgi:CBS domain containing-hemolysin-like protein
MEAVLLSTTPSYLNTLKQQKNNAAGRIISLKENIDRPLSAILSFNTIAHTIGAAGVGAQAVKVFGEASFGIVSAILTLLILVVTEIIPKTIGAMYWRKLAIISGHIIQVMIIITYPLVAMSASITRILSKKHNEKTTSREEISALANIGQEEGIFAEKENKIIQNLIKLKGLKVTSIMTPRVVVAAVDESIQLKDFPKTKPLLHFSRIPVFEGNPDNITGYVFRQDIFEALAQGKELEPVKSLRREIVFVPESQPVFRMWEILLQRKEHIALVSDEYGGMAGIVTMEDIIETLLGFEIMDEKDTIADMQKYAMERWQKRQQKFTFLENLRSGTSPEK